MSVVPSPGWFARHRARVLSLWVALGVAGSTFVWTGRYIATLEVVFGFLAVGGLVTTFLLVHGAASRSCRLIRKGAGLAVLLHAGRVVSLLAGLVFAEDVDLPWGWPWRDGATVGDWPFVYTTVGTTLVVAALALQAGWLYWVAGLQQSCQGRP